MNRIAVLDDWQRVARSSADWKALEARALVEFFDAPFADEAEAAARLAPYDIVLAVRERTPFPASLVHRLPRLRMFGMTGARAARIDVDAMHERGIVVCYTGSGPSGIATAELTLGLMLAATRRVAAADAAVRAGRFQAGVDAGTVLAGKTLGLIGAGRIGARMARYAQALEMQVLAWSPQLTPERAEAAGAEYAAKEHLLATSDVVSLHLVLSERTRHVLAAADLARMRSGALLINTARAGLVDEEALVREATSGRLCAALDVYGREPLPAGHPLGSLPNVVLTPHLGYSVREVYAEYYQHAVENVLAYLDDKPIRVVERSPQ